MLIKLHINTDNAAFDDDFGVEVARILRYAADRVDNRMLQHNGVQLFDTNGICVGALYAQAIEEETDANLLDVVANDRAVLLDACTAVRDYARDSRTGRMLTGEGYAMLDAAITKATSH